MAETNVTIAGLARVRDALSEFQVDMEVVCRSIDSKVTQEREEAQDALLNCQACVAALEEELARVMQEVRQMRELIDALEQQRAALEHRKEKLLFEERQLVARVSLLEDTINALKSQIARSKGEEKNALMARLQQKQEELWTAQANLKEVRDLGVQAKLAIEHIESDLRDSRAQLGRKEQEAQQVEDRLSQYRDKLERLSEAGRQLEDSLQSLTTAVHRFSANSSDDAASVAGAVSRAYHLVERYHGFGLK